MVDLSIIGYSQVECVAWKVGGIRRGRRVTRGKGTTPWSVSEWSPEGTDVTSLLRRLTLDHPIGDLDLLKTVSPSSMLPNADRWGFKTAGT